MLGLVAIKHNCFCKLISSEAKSYSLSQTTPSCIYVEGVDVFPRLIALQAYRKSYLNN